MGGEWTVTDFADAIDFQEGPGILAKDFHDHGVPLVRLSGLDRGASLLSGCNYLDPDLVEKKWSHFALQKGDILLSASASLGRIAVVDDEGVGAIAYTGIIRMRPRDERLIAPFIRYLLEGPNFQQQAEAFGAGSVIRHFGPMHLRQMNVLLPPPVEQRAIAHILGTLDDKIELNRRRNQTLEAMARALFKDWFVDFGPVRAKMEGREPYLPADLWQHFPDRLDDEGKPEGWSERPLDEIADFLNGLALQKFPATNRDDSLPVIKIAELRNGVSAKSDRASREVPAKYIIKDGDFLFSWSGSLLAKFWTEGEGALNQHLFKVTSEHYPIWFVSHWVHHHLEEFQAIAASKATTMGHIQRGHLKAAMTLCPPENVLERLGVVIAPLISQAILNELESRKLAQLRDTLLPKLISGELRIPDVEAFLKECGL
jgi:type I restriction enzyme S subunit